MSKEIWKDVVGFEGYYQVSNLRRVKRVAPGGSSSYAGRILEGPTVTLCKPGRRRQVSVRSLVYEAFGILYPASLEGEGWKAVVGYEGYYEVSNMGRVMRIKPGGNTYAGRILKPFSMGGYLVADLRRLGKQERIPVHTLVLEAFVGPCPPGHECHHENEDRRDNRLENLEWVTSGKHHRVLHPPNMCVSKETPS